MPYVDFTIWNRYTYAHLYGQVTLSKNDTRMPSCCVGTKQQWFKTTVAWWKMQQWIVLMANGNCSSNKIIVRKGWLVLFCLNAIPSVCVYRLFGAPFEIMTALKQSFKQPVWTHKRCTKSRRLVTTMSTITIFSVCMGHFLIVWEVLFKQWCVWTASQTIMGNNLDD